MLAVLDWGGLAEEAAALEVNTFAIPDSMEFRHAIPFTNSYHTSYAALCWPNMLRLAAGETLLVHGAAGGVGIAAVEIGKIVGARVIATAGSAEKLEAARQHGADHAINYREGDFREEVLAITGGRGADVIYDPVGGEVFDTSLRCIAFEGRIMPVGFAGGTIQQIPANILLVKTVTVVGMNFGTYVGWSPKDIRYEVEDRMRGRHDAALRLVRGRPPQAEGGPDLPAGGLQGRDGGGALAPRHRAGRRGDGAVAMGVAEGPSPQPCWRSPLPPAPGWTGPACRRPARKGRRRAGCCRRAPFRSRGSSARRASMPRWRGSSAISARRPTGSASA